MEDAIAAWESEGGFAARSTGHGMIGTLNQIAWAVQIKSQVEAEFDRVRKVLEDAITKQTAEDLGDIQAIIRILEDKRVEVMENEQAGYFIHDCQELRDQVSRMIVGDPRYDVIKTGAQADSGYWLFTDRIPTPKTHDSRTPVREDKEKTQMLGTYKRTAASDTWYRQLFKVRNH